MSSHHFVTENQSPALILANGQICEYELLAHILEWNPKVVVLDGAIHSVLDLGIKFDVWLGDFDNQSLTDQELAHQQPLEIVHTPNQDKTDLEKAFDYLLDQNISDCYVLWATGKRADHYLNNLSSVVKYFPKLTATLLDDYSKIYPIQSGFKKKYPNNYSLSIMPMGAVTGFTSKGLKYPLTNEELALGVRTSSSNEVSGDGWVEITFNSGNILMMECKDWAESD